MLRFHAMIRSQDKGGANFVKLAEISVDHSMEIQCALFFWGKLMLDVICGRQIHHVGAPLSKKLDASSEDEL